MASKTLLAGELARRNKGIEPTNIEAVAGYSHCTLARSSVGGIQTEASNNGTGTDWKMVLYNSQQQNQQGNDSMRSSFSVATPDLVGMEPVNLGHPAEYGHKLRGPHFSNPSSLITSLGSSREGSPESMGPGLGFGKAPMESKFIGPPSGPVGSPWCPTPAISISPLLVFAAMGDA